MLPRRNNEDQKIHGTYFLKSKYSFWGHGVTYCVKYFILLMCLFIGVGAFASDFKSFEIIARQNIFNLNKNAPNTNQIPKISDFFVLNGILISEKGDFAFFQSNSNEFSRAFYQNELIFDHEIIKINPNEVLLKFGTTNLVLNVNSGLSRTEEKDWKVFTNASANEIQNKKPNKKRTR